MLMLVMLSVMLSATYKPSMLNVVMLNFVMLSVIMLSVVLLPLECSPLELHVLDTNAGKPLSYAATDV
jgi:hypothetical protein